MQDSSTTAQKVAAEALGTFVLVFFGAGTAVFSGGDYVATALAFGLTVLVAVYAFGRISGGHFNPAVTVGAAVGGRIAWRQTPVYIGSQLVGALVAGLLLFVLTKGIDGYDIGLNGLGQNSFGDDGSGFAWWAALLVEVVMTAVFLFVILGVTDARNEHPGLAPLAIGLSLAMIHFASINLTGTSVNPARSIGVGVFAGTDAVKDLWLFIVAPLLGAGIAGAAYPLLFGHGTEPVPGSGLTFAGGTRASAPGTVTDSYQQEWNQQQTGADQRDQHEQHEQAAWEQEPIIQDGWQWDHAAQEWKPLEQWQPAAPAQASTTDPAAVSPGEQPAADTTRQVPQQSWTDTTQIRPPQ